MRTSYQQFYFDAICHLQGQVVAVKKLRVNITDPNEPPSLEDIVDLIYTLRESKRIYEETLKDLNKLYAFSQQMACLLGVRDETEVVKTEYCTGSLNPKTHPKIPSKRRYNPEQFDELMKRLNIPEELIEKEVVRPNWSAIQDYIVEKTAQGELWPGYDESFMTYEVSIHKRQDILDDS
jgi:hypothetical protein